ncbi:MAG: hypothetical protein IJB80_02555 [Clostridia bacterium]|nr:hypothetical protein [Clostridia bacterium]
MEEQADRIFLKFDGITYYAKVFLNDLLIGEMIPYCEYSFDITDKASEKNNRLVVEIEDIAPVFGPTEGWENFGGIIRDVSVIYKKESYIEDVFFHCMLKNQYQDAEFVVETTATNPSGCKYNIRLLCDNKEVITYTQNTGETLAKNVSGVKLWSPDTPNLYQLEVALLKDGVPVDTYCCNVGFREFSHDRHRFLLNGAPIFLKGVCKHEMFGDSGHCPTDEQMLTDLQMIKDAGCNFVRLVHYPHNKKILQIADKLGLMVSEEPGLWWSDTADPEISNGSLEVLRRTILRDRNHPSIVFWLCFNECRFTEQYLIDSANICREYDPTRMVSGANCMSNEDTLKYYNICGFDFYTMHPYSQTVDMAIESARILHDKPLLFTEWGGHFVYDNPKLLGEFLDEMYKLYLANSDEGALAGAFFWEWSELNDFNRGKPACIDGNLSEGLVDRYRKPRLIYSAFCDALQRMGKESQDPFWITYESEEPCNSVPLGEGDKEKMNRILSGINKEEAANTKMRKRRLTKGPVLDIDGFNEIPAILCDGDSFTISCDWKTDTLKLYGMVSLTKGYPLKGEYGEEVATLIVDFQDGSNQKLVLKNGVDITTVFGLYASSRINPIAENSKRIATFGYDKNFESYILNESVLRFDKIKQMKSISLISKNNGYALLLYGIANK